MTTQQKIRSVRRKLAELMRLREPSSIINPSDPIERECMRLANTLCKHEEQWKAEKSTIDRNALAGMEAA